ncbi:quaternary ammonium compound-resistance protein SugE [Orbus hercynius]|uniref:Guanidinium exporter n=1 Tax=Orbus hercynius TaxID=593135 RepID=A0A495RB69_9GAMM|nr:quaternary ammonium compound efflux SMR transporter SugE [Orbus hercynius]RKS84639.1 quaternary ammonium compound-resistance protein SugE [Orbus hercynius]
MAWIYLIIAGIFEIIWVISLKYSHGFTRLTPSIVTILTMICSFVLLAQAIKSLPMGTAYAVWTSIGIIGATLIGIFVFNESMAPIRLICLALVIIGVIGLKLTSS